MAADLSSRNIPGLIEELEEEHATTTATLLQQLVDHIHAGRRARGEEECKSGKSRNDRYQSMLTHQRCRVQLGAGWLGELRGTAHYCTHTMMAYLLFRFFPPLSVPFISRVGR